MGTLSEKLDYLAETKQMLREKLEEMGATITDEDTFRSYVEKLNDVTDTMYITRALRAEYPTMNDIIGELDIKSSMMICPKIIVPSEEDGNTNTYVMIPYTARNTNALHTAAVTGLTINYEKIKVLSENIPVRIALNMVKPSTLILPEKIALVQYTLYNGSSGTDAHSFTRGLGFGKSVYSCASTWIQRTLSTTKRVVKFPKDFQMTSGVTLYLSKIYITQECLKEMVQNLYEYTDGTTRTINIGTTNKALLASDEIALAESKGWAIT